MGTGYCGTFVISWSQTWIDGQRNAPAEALEPGATWAWQGEALRVDGPASILPLARTETDDRFRSRASRAAQRIAGRLAARRGSDDSDTQDDLPGDSFTLSDGRALFTVTRVASAGRQSLLVFRDDIPPRGVRLWVMRSDRVNRPEQDDRSVICFTPGTRIATPSGPRLVETLAEGDLVATRDSGPQPVQWIGQRHLPGADLYARPGLRPIRIEAGRFGLGRPDAPLLLSPGHRLLLRGGAARLLFNTEEVLVAAVDLLGHSGISRDLSLRSVTYIHLMLPQHAVLFANGVETESFHPTGGALGALSPLDRERLLQTRPELSTGSNSYGDHARRPLTQAEAAILLHRAA